MTASEGLLVMELAAIDPAGTLSLPADAGGSEKPDPTAVQTFVQQICSNPQAAGQQFRTAVQAGGSQAQVAVLALFQVGVLLN